MNKLEFGKKKKEYNLFASCEYKHDQNAKCYNCIASFNTNSLGETNYMFLLYQTVLIN